MHCLSECVRESFCLSVCVKEYVCKKEKERETDRIFKKETDAQVLQLHALLLITVLLFQMETVYIRK